jgi:membrane-associated protease RseP (regulator of RpoE activity)
MQTIRVQTPGCAAARCELANDRGTWQLARTPGSVTVTVSRQPLRATCRSEASVVGGALASSSRPATSGAGAVTGGVVGGAATGAALGATALAFIPPLGVVAVLTGASVGAVAGDAAERRSHPLRYPDVVSIPMNCPAVDAGSTQTQQEEAPRLGLGIRGLTLAQAQAAGLKGRTAVIVTSVAEGSLAAASGLRDGDVVLALNGQDVLDAADLEERVLALPRTLPLALRVWRDGHVLELLLTRSPKDAP